MSWPRIVYFDVGHFTCLLVCAARCKHCLLSDVAAGVTNGETNINVNSIALYMMALDKGQCPYIPGDR